MAHRALVCYLTGDTSTLHYAHWGADLARAITPRRPFGGLAARQSKGRDGGTSATIARLAERFGLDPAEGYTPLTRVDPRPLARDVDAEMLWSAIDDTIESLVVVDEAYATTTYLVCPLGLDGGGPLVLVGPVENAAAVREWFVTTKSRLSERVGQGAITPAVARGWLRRGLAARGRVYSPDDAPFLRRD